MGRDPKLLADLSRKTGINIITNVGWYAADNGRHLPREIKDMSAEEIALFGSAKTVLAIRGSNWRYQYAIDGIGLSKMIKLVAAACITHLETGLTIMSHTVQRQGYAQLKILEKYGVDPSPLFGCMPWKRPREASLTIAERESDSF